VQAWTKPYLTERERETERQREREKYTFLVRKIIIQNIRNEARMFQNGKVRWRYSSCLIRYIFYYKTNKLRIQNIQYVLGGNVPELWRTILVLNYIDKITNSHISEVERLHTKWREKNVVFLKFHFLYPFSVMRYPYSAHVRPWVASRAKRVHAATSESTTVIVTVRCEM
jgi:hypothetical protein